MKNKNYSKTYRYAINLYIKKEITSLMSCKLKTLLDNCINVSYHHQFYDAFHIPNHIIINFIPAHIINSSNGKQAASSISQSHRKTLTAMNRFE